MHDYGSFFQEVLVYKEIRQMIMINTIEWLYLVMGSHLGDCFFVFFKKKIKSPFIPVVPFLVTESIYGRTVSPYLFVLFKSQYFFFIDLRLF